MTVDKKEIKYIAELSNLEIDEKEIERFGEQISDIIEYFQKLDNLDLEDVDPMSHAQNIDCPDRKDEPGES